MNTNSTNDVLWKVKRLINVMQNSVKQWTKRNNEPTLNDIAESMRTWSSDFAAIAIHTKSNVSSFQNARKTITDAWDNRDNRTKAMENIKLTLKYLKTVEKELADPEFTPSHSKIASKALFGDYASRYSSDPDVFQELWQARRAIEGLRETRHEFVDSLEVGRVKSMLDGVLERYPYDDNVMYQHATEVQRHMDVAQRYIDQPRYFYSALKSAAEIVDGMGAHADVAFSPDDYKPEAEVGKESIKAAMGVVDRLTYAQPFTNPSILLRQAVIKSTELRNEIDTYYDPKALRLADNIVSDFKQALQISSIRRVKSIGMSGWSVGEVREPYHSALTGLSRLQSYIENL